MNKILILKSIKIGSKFFTVFSWIIGLTLILPFIGVLIYFSYQEHYNIGTLTLIEKYDNREWKIPHHFMGTLDMDSKVAQKQLQSSGYFGNFYFSANQFSIGEQQFVFFESGTTLRVLSKWYEYREPSGFMDEGTNLDIYLLEDKSGRFWTTNDFTVDEPAGFGDPLDRVDSEYMLFEALYRFKELYMLVTYNPSGDSHTVNEVVAAIFPRNTYSIIENPKFSNTIYATKQDMVVTVKTYDDLIKILNENAASVLKFQGYLTFTPLYSSGGILYKFVP